MSFLTDEMIVDSERLTLAIQDILITMFLMAKENPFMNYGEESYNLAKSMVERLKEEP